MLNITEYVGNDLDWQLKHWTKDKAFILEEFSIG